MATYFISVISYSCFITNRWSSNDIKPQRGTLLILIQNKHSAPVSQVCGNPEIHFLATCCNAVSPDNMRIFQLSSGVLHKQTPTLRHSVQTKRDFPNDSKLVTETGKWQRYTWQSPEKLNNLINNSSRTPHKTACCTVSLAAEQTQDFNSVNGQRGNKWGRISMKSTMKWKRKGAECEVGD